MMRPPTSCVRVGGKAPPVLPPSPLPPLLQSLHTSCSSVASHPSHRVSSFFPFCLLFLSGSGHVKLLHCRFRDASRNSVLVSFKFATNLRMPHVVGERRKFGDILDISR